MSECTGSLEAVFKSKSRKRNGRKAVTSDQNEECQEIKSSVVRVPSKKVFDPVLKSSNVRLTAKQCCKTFCCDKPRSEESDLKESITSVNYSAGEVVEKRKFATSYREFDTDSQTDSKAIFEKHLEQTKSNVTSDGLYHGLSAYQTFREIKDTIKGNASSSAVRQGPVRATQNIRVTTRWDYHPEICKDYKETGFCGFGDSCKFIHDRSDYKSGWEIDKEIEENKQKIDYKAYEIKSSDDESDEISLFCSICGNRFVQPVKTKCAHYFCESCALKNYQKSGKCYVCSAQTYGIFNPANEVQKKLEDFEEKLVEKEASGDSDFNPSDLENVGENDVHIVNECDEAPFATPSQSEED